MHSRSAGRLAAADVPLLVRMPENGKRASWARQMGDQLFLYGTLRDGDVFGAVTGRPHGAFSPRRLRLAGFRAAQLAAAPFPALVPAPGTGADGLALAGLDAATLARLARYEGPGYRLARLRRLGADSLLAFLPVGGLEILAEDWRIAEWAAAHKAELLAALRRSRPIRRARKP